MNDLSLFDFLSEEELGDLKNTPNVNKDEKNNNYKTFKMIHKIITFLFYGTLMLLASYYIFSFSSNFLGVQVMHVVSNSMSPTFSKDDSIIVATKGYNSIDTGDIIVYSNPGFLNGDLITHRVVYTDKTRDEYYLKGDNNTATDPVITSDEIIGEVIYTIPGFAKILNSNNIIATFLFLIFLIIADFFSLKKIEKIEKISESRNKRT